MKRILLLPILLCLLAGCGAIPAFAQSIDRPVLSLARVQLGAAANYAFFNSAESGASSQFQIKREWQVGVVGAYNVLAPVGNAKGTTVSLVGGSLYGVDSRWFYSYVGVRVGLYDGSRQ